MSKNFLKRLSEQLDDIERQGLRKTERELETPQGTHIKVGGRDVLNFCANNYLGLANDAALKEIARQAITDWGYGLSSVRFICGTQTQHRELEQTIAAFFRLDDALLYSSCFDANGGVFETLLGAKDVILSDALNHASIIDGIRLSKAEVRRYEHSDLHDLEKHLQETLDKRSRLVVTDGVFSMDGEMAKLAEICDLAKRYDAVVMVDDSHGSGVVGATGRGTPEARGAMERIDILTSTFGKAFGGASGGFVAARQPIIDLLRQRSRPYLFSNSLVPMIVATSLHLLKNFDRYLPHLERLRDNSLRFRSGMGKAGFDLRPGTHPIVPVMLYDAADAKRMADALLERGIYVIGFWHPVVPHDQARIRVQISAAHLPEEIDLAVNAFVETRDQLGLTPKKT